MAKILIPIKCNECGNDRLVNLSRSNIEKYVIAHPRCNKCSKCGLKNAGQFKKGMTTWNKGKRGAFTGKTIDALHDWVERNLGKPRICDFCSTTESKIYQWSNKSGQYKVELADWQRLCVKCHQRYDFEKFGARKTFYVGRRGGQTSG